MTDSSTEDLIGSRVGPCLVTRRIALGGMSVLYEAVVDGSGLKVALKVIRPEHAHDFDFVRRIAAELEAALHLDHPNIVRVFTRGELPDKRPWLSLELLDGLNLTQTTGRTPLSRAAVVQVLEQTLSALDHAHQRSVIHRDLKPDNLFLLSTPEVQVKLLDFGLARHSATPGGPAAQTHQNRGVGTPAYCAPEQAVGHAVSAASDLYSFGALAYELLLGRRPFLQRQPLEVLRAHLHQPVPPPRTVDPDFPPTAERWLLQLLEKKPADRPPSAAVALAGLQSVRAGLLAQTAPSDGRIEPHQARTAVDGFAGPQPTPLPWWKSFASALGWKRR